ncbi:MAG: HAMP domain-containing histidine kinase [Lactobacillales bacterium]|nr:HAMP domain-containing histidine kinase [Lactobacillales bacterium]
MNLFENILLNVILILFPLLICILYEAYNKIYDFKKSDLCLDFAIISAFYLVMTFKSSDYTFPYLLMNVPLIIAYLKNRKKCILILSVVCMIILSKVYESMLIYIILEYVLYFVIYIVFKNYKMLLLNLFLILKIIFYFICEAITKSYLEDIKYLGNAIMIIIPFILVTYIVYFMLRKSAEIIRFQKDLKNLEEEKELRLSLFKITHEIKNPITVCKGYLDMFNYENPKKSKKYVEIMKNEIKRVLVLLEDFLSINKIKIEKDIIDINLLLEEVTNNFIPLLKDKNIDGVFNISKDELFIEADYNRLNQVLINLIKNSIESIGSNGLIKINLNKTKNSLEIKIEDNGIGMDKDELKRISEPFFTTKENGTGLGVFLSKQIVEAHNGTIKYTSKKYVGTKTTIKLPYKEIKF